MLKVGIIGTGFMGATHAAGWAKTPAKIAGFYSKSPDTLQSLSAQHHANAYESAAALIADVDIVDVCAPTHRHHELVLQAAAAGKHIVCEKPLARTAAQGRAMLEACQKAGVHLLVAHVVRFFPEYAAAKRTVEHGDIGQVAVLRLTRASFKPGAPDSWFHEHEKSGGMMLDLMIHDFDYARWVAGDVLSVFAKKATSGSRAVDGDYGLAILRHKNGALSHIEGGWAYPRPMFRTALEIAGDAGLIEHPAESSAPLGVYLKQTEAKAAPTIATPRSPVLEDPYTTEIKHFYEVITGAESTPRVTAEDGFAALQIALAAIQSAETGRPVKLEEVR